MLKTGEVKQEMIMSHSTVTEAFVCFDYERFNFIKWCIVKPLQAATSMLQLTVSLTKPGGQPRTANCSFLIFIRCFVSNTAAVSYLLTSIPSTSYAQKYM